MSSQNGEWIHAGSLADIPDGEARTVDVGEGRTLAVFHVEGRVYATDNQCPHMGYPLTRGMVRHGVLTCDWHGRSFDLEGGGCFNYECDDLQTFPVENRDGEIYVAVEDFVYRRKSEHMRLLWEGLLSTDGWTISKAIALLLNGGVAEEEIVELIVRHLGRHVAGRGGGDINEQGGFALSILISGLKVGRRYDGEDRLMALTITGRAAGGGAAERLEVIELPPPVTWEQLDSWLRMFSRNSQGNRIERCLFTAKRQGFEDNIIPLLYECATESYFLGFADSLTYLSDLSEIVETFGWEQAGELAFILGARMIGNGRGEPERFKRDAVRIMNELLPDIQALDLAANSVVDYDEDALVQDLLSVDIERSFNGVANALKAGVKIERLITTFVLLVADRMARKPLTVDENWFSMSTEFDLASSLRLALKHGGHEAAAKALFHMAWQLFEGRFINIPARALSEAAASGVPADVETIRTSINSLNIQDVGAQVLGYREAGNSGDALLKEIGHEILWDDTNTRLISTLRAAFSEWEHVNSGDPALGAGHPAANQILVGLARYATDIRLNKNSGRLEIASASQPSLPKRLVKRAILWLLSSKESNNTTI